MNTQLITSWVLTVAFLATGGYSLMQMAARGSWATRVGHSTHVLMCAVMAAMPWAWAAGLPPVPVIVAFLAAGAWHLAVAVLRPTDLGDTARRSEGRFLGLTHAGMMLGMVWMTVLMSYVGDSGAAGMSGMAGMSGDAGHAGHAAHAAQVGQPLWAHGLTLVFVAGFLVVGCWFLAEYGRRSDAQADRAPGRTVSDGLAGGVMSVAMAASLATMW